jgi:hypothetical protein
MSRRNSSTIVVSQGSSPRDINGSVPNVVDEEIPSRSYYSSHLAIEPGGNYFSCINIIYNI